MSTTSNAFFSFEQSESHSQMNVVKIVVQLILTQDIMHSMTASCEENFQTVEET